MRFILVFLLFTTTTFGSDINRIQKVIMRLQPIVTPKAATKIAENIKIYSGQLKLDWKIFLAILFQESSLRRDPQGCLSNANCHDFGIGQINWKVWSKELNLNKRLLLTDYDYAIHVSYRILKRYRHFATNDSVWYLRYHSHTSSLRQTYGRFIRKKHAKIVNILEDLEHGRQQDNKVRRRQDSYAFQETALHNRGNPFPIFNIFRQSGGVRLQTRFTPKYCLLSRREWWMGPS